MIPYVLYHDEHYKMYLEKQGARDTVESFRCFLKEIGTTSLSFQNPIKTDERMSFLYKQVPEGSCIRLRTSHGYTAVLHQKLFPASHEKQDKSQRSTSCSIV